MEIRSNPPITLRNTASSPCNHYEDMFNSDIYALKNATIPNPLDNMNHELMYGINEYGKYSLQITLTVPSDLNDMLLPSWLEPLHVYYDGKEIKETI